MADEPEKKDEQRPMVHVDLPGVDVELSEKAFKAAGIRKSYTGSYQIWNPSEMGVQNIDTLEAGAEAAAKVFEKYGFQAYAGSRLD